VIGYCTQRKKDITEAIASVPADCFIDQPLSNVEQALKGQVTGGQVHQALVRQSGSVTVKNSDIVAC